MIPGCLRHRRQFDRDCPDARCRRNWVPDGAPTPGEQLARWAAGEPFVGPRLEMVGIDRVTREDWDRLDRVVRRLFDEYDRAFEDQP